MKKKGENLKTEPFRKRYFLHSLIVVCFIVWIITAIEPISRTDWILENVLVAVCALILLFRYKKMPLSNLSYFLFTVFLCFHLVGAHYTYAKVPLGHWMKDTFDLSRNHYDRVIHFSFGFSLAYPLTEIFTRRIKRPLSQSRRMSFAFILGISVAYEMIEIITAYVVSPELGMAYLGTQGDNWDGVKDILCAVVGAALSLWVLNFSYHRQKKTFFKELK